MTVFPPRYDEKRVSLPVMDQQTEALIRMALDEDIGSGDVTSGYFVPEDRQAVAVAMVKAEGVIAGLEVAKKVYESVDPSLEVSLLMEDGQRVRHGSKVMKIVGSARSILTAERTSLNFLQRLSGVATKTRSFVDAVKGTEAKVLDTRKTTPGWRYLEKAAVLAGGGVNHRMGLYDRAMVKDNHLVAEGGLERLQVAIDQLKDEKPDVEVELEVDTLDQLKNFLTLTGVDYILLDNMSNDELRKAVTMRNGLRPYLEASGGVTLDTIQAIAQTGVDYISVGAVTHSAVALDISLDFQAL